MKTAISLPDALFADAEKIAKDLGIARSQLFAKALEEFIRNHRTESITMRLNEVYGGPPGSEAELLASANIEALRELTRDDAW
jgi:hypothetical protein